jgi:hypothetical protein
MVLPAAHDGALNNATKGFAVGAATGVLPLTSGVTLKDAVCEADSPELKSLATTWI